jgi:hypothetical protein
MLYFRVELRTARAVPGRGDDGTMAVLPSLKSEPGSRPAEVLRAGARCKSYGVCAPGELEFPDLGVRNTPAGRGSYRRKRRPMSRAAHQSSWCFGDGLTLAWSPPQDSRNGEERAAPERRRLPFDEEPDAGTGYANCRADTRRPYGTRSRPSSGRYAGAGSVQPATANGRT